MRWRARARGKFLFDGDEKLYVRGVTYGTFRPDREGWEFPQRDVAQRDLDGMLASGVNAVRVYTVPPRWLLDEAGDRGLRVAVGLPWEQHVAFLDEPKRVSCIESRVRAGVAACAGHPAVLCYSVGNEIPAHIVRWAGSRRIERFLHRLYRAAREEDPAGLITYANYPSTEYLDLSFFDLVCFNVYLEHDETFGLYLARLQNLAGDRPLLLGELGLDSRRHGGEGQARFLEAQLRTAFAGGCAGTFVFAWTDEWHRGGQQVADWRFGLTTRERAPKPALEAVRRAYHRVPFPREAPRPRMSVVVCVRNGETTLSDCLEGIGRLEYPDFEVIVVDDGSEDRTAEIASAYPCQLIRTQKRGLSAARNVGMNASSGEIVAYIDADARPDPHWLLYLAATFEEQEWVGVGGPNVPVAGDGVVADCVAQAPGGPTHVLLSDREAEHIPGCNMAFRRSALEAVRGFDPRFRAAGDDVDLCWRLQERGWKLGFSPSAVVWHHQRDSVDAYWRQQRGYGHAEALLEAKWPEKYNAAGQVTWHGRVYAKPLLYALSRVSRVYHGTWGMAPFQPRHARPRLVTDVAAAPEWNLVLLALAGLSLLGLAWSPLVWALPLLLLAAGATLWRALRGALHARFPSTAEPGDGWRRRVLVGWLYLLQPAARLQGRLSNGLTPWRFRRLSHFIPPLPRQVQIWSESWRGTAEWLQNLERRMRSRRVAVQRGGPYDRWDLQVRGGSSGVVRLRMCLEEHGGGRQLARFRLWPRPRWMAVAWLAALPAALGAGAARDGAWVAATLLWLLAAGFLVRLFRQSGVAMALVIESLDGDPRRSLGRSAQRRPAPAPPRQARAERAG